MYICPRTGERGPEVVDSGRKKLGMFQRLLTCDLEGQRLPRDLLDQGTSGKKSLASLTTEQVPKTPFEYQALSNIISMSWPWQSVRCCQSVCAICTKKPNAPHVGMRAVFAHVGSWQK